MTNQISVSETISLPLHDAWEKLRDLSLAGNYVPGVVKVEISTARLEGVGASRKIYQSDSRWIDETVEEWQDGEGFLLRLHQGNKPALPFKKAWFRYHIEPRDSEHTLVTAILIYEWPLGILGWLADRVVLRRILRGMITDVVHSMKLYYESGRATTPESLQQYKARQR